MLAGARFAQQELHRRVSTVTLAFLAGHVLTSVLDTYVPIGWAAVVVPLASSHKRLWVAVGTVGLAVGRCRSFRYQLRPTVRQEQALRQLLLFPV